MFPIFNNYRVVAAGITKGRSATQTQTNNPATFTIAFSGSPPSLGSLLFAYTKSNCGGGLISGGSTWNPDSNNVAGVDMVYSKIAGGSEPASYTVVHGGATKSDRTAAIILEFTNADASNPDAVGFDGTSGTTCPSATASTAADYAIAAIFGTSNLTPQTGLGVGYVIEQQTANNNICVATKQLIVSGLETPGAWSQTGGRKWLHLAK